MLAGATLGLLLSLTAWYSQTKNNDNQVIDRINDLLPQTQCAGCGYAGCRPYAQAIWEGDAINKCAPGGETVITALATLLNRSDLPLDTNFGEQVPPHVAFIREQDCIGCGRCLSVCPVDAIVGTPEYMHTIIKQDCTGCDLCIAECPVDCIDTLNLSEPKLMPPEKAKQACIRCGYCEQVCPVQLPAQRLYETVTSDQPSRSAALGLDHCIECGLCEQVCPSQLPLTASFHAAKHNERARQRADLAASQAEARFHAKEQRLLQTEKARLLRRQKRLSHLQALKN